MTSQTRKSSFELLKSLKQLTEVEPIWVQSPIHWSFFMRGLHGPQRGNLSLMSTERYSPVWFGMVEGIRVSVFIQSWIITAHGGYFAHTQHLLLFERRGKQPLSSSQSTDFNSSSALTDSFHFLRFYTQLGPKNGMVLSDLIGSFYNRNAQNTGLDHTVEMRL